MKQKRELSRQNSVSLFEKRYSVGRINILIMAALTLVNVTMLALGQFTYFLFSAAIPYLLVDYGMFFTGRYPEEVYEEFGGYTEFYGESLFFITVILSIVIVLFYALCYWLSKKQRVGWIIAALVAFIFDTAVMFYAYDLKSSIIDILFHIYAIVYFALAISAHFKLKDLMANEEGIESDAENGQADTAENEATEDAPEESSPIRMADNAVKFRMLLDADVLGHRVEYRRVKRVNELVIDGYVYDEYTALAEKAHMLTAVINGHYISAGFNGKTSSYISLDGNNVKTKIRWI